MTDAIDSPAAPGALQRLVAGVVRLLVDNPDAVEVTTETGPGATILRLRVAPSDIGKLIGKQGRTVRSLRTLVSAVAHRSDRLYELDIVDGDPIP